MKRLVWVFICGVFSTILSGCGGVPASNSLSNISFDPRTVVPPSAWPKANTCDVILPENMSLLSAYTGECMNGRANGSGKITVEKTYPKNAGKFTITYEGMFLNGKLTGKGKETEKFGNHWYEGTFNEWKRWTGTVHFAQAEKKKARQIYLEAGSVTSHPVDVTKDPLYYAKASVDDKKNYAKASVNNKKNVDSDTQDTIANTWFSIPTKLNAFMHSYGCYDCHPKEARTTSSAPSIKTIKARYTEFPEPNLANNIINGSYGTSEKNKAHHPRNTDIANSVALATWLNGGSNTSTYTSQTQQASNSQKLKQSTSGAAKEGSPEENSSTNSSSNSFLNKVSELFENALLNAVDQKMNDWAVRQDRRLQEKYGQQEQTYITYDNVPCDRTPPSGAAPYAPGICRDPSTGGGQISREFLEKNPQYAERVRRALNEEARQKQAKETQDQRSLAIQRAISPPTNNCASPSLLFPGTCNSAGNCDDIRSSGQVPCSLLTPAQLEQLQRRGREVSAGIAQRQQDYLNMRAAADRKARDDQARIDRAVAESARQNAIQHEKYAQQEKQIAENWAAYQRKQAEDSKRFDAEQKQQQEMQIAARNAEIEKERLAREAWEKSNREKQAIAEAERQRNLAAQEELRKQQERANKGSVVNPPIQSPQGVTQQATSAPSTIPAPQQTAASYSSLTQTLLQNTARQSQNGQSGNLVSPGLGTTTSSTFQPSSYKQQNEASAENAKQITKTEFIYDCNHFPGQGALGRSYTDNERKFVADCSARSARTIAEINASNQRIDTGIKIAKNVQTGAEIAGTGVAVATGIADGVLLARGAYAAGKTVLEKQAVKTAESVATREVDSASTGGINKTESIVKKTSNQLGKDGEAAVREMYDIGEKLPISINGRTRIPDGLNIGSKTISEIKNTENLSLTEQLHDDIAYAQREGFRFDLYVRPDTKLSEPLIDAIKSGLINLRYIPR